MESADQEASRVIHPGWLQLEARFTGVGVTKVSSSSAATCRQTRGLWMFHAGCSATNPEG